MNERVREFLELMENNPELKSKVDEMNTPDATAADFIALAKEYGIEITEQDLTPEKSTTELTGDELDAVTGGVVVNDGPSVCIQIGISFPSCSWFGRLTQ